jgi:uncharacterized protein with HEPN domain
VPSNRHPERARERAAHILSSIDAIDRFLFCIDFERYETDRMIRSAVERELLIISEAITRLVELEEALPERERFQHRFPHVAVYQIRGMGNHLRHAYPTTDNAIVWETATGDDLKDLRAAVLQAYTRVKGVKRP